MSDLPLPRPCCYRLQKKRQALRFGAVIALADMGWSWYVQRRWNIGFPPDRAFFIITNNTSTNDDDLVTDLWTFRYDFDRKRVARQHEKIRTGR